MPYVSRSKRKKMARKSAVARRRRYVKSRRGPKTKVSIGIGFPKQLTMKHKYCESAINYGSTAGSVAKYTWSCNSMYDPNGTLGGHQSYYYDQIGAIYNHWTVIGSKIKFTLCPITQNSAPTYVCLFINDDQTTTPSDIDALSEFGYRMQIIPIDKLTPTVVTASWSAKKAFGGSVLNNSLLRGTVAAAAHPTEQQWYTLAMQSAGGSVTQSYAVSIEIEYIAVWTELKDLSSS